MFVLDLLQLADQRVVFCVADFGVVENVVLVLVVPNGGAEILGLLLRIGVGLAEYLADISL